MPTWACFLPPITQVADGAAIVTLAGNVCGQLGSWKATTSEEQHYAQLIQDPQAARTKRLSYDGRKFATARVLEDTIIAQLGKEGLIVQRASTVLVAAHFVEGQSVNSVSSRVDQVVGHLLANGA
jgi:hypothetical protein